MSSEIHISVSQLDEVKSQLFAGQRVFLSGTVYTARDAAHKRIVDLIENNRALPFELKGAVIYYAGPSPSDGDKIGSFGPTTSSRMDKFTRLLLENGLSAMIGKGDRNADVTDAVKKHKAVYFCAGGGMGALISKTIASCEEIAFSELGCESVKKLEVKDMPLIVGIDSEGKSVFTRD